VRSSSHSQSSRPHVTCVMRCCRYASNFIQTKAVQFLLSTFSSTEKDGFVCYKTVPTIQSGVAPALFSLLSRAHLRCKRTRECGTGKHLGSRSSAVALALQSLIFFRILTPSLLMCPPVAADQELTIIPPSRFPTQMRDSKICVLVRVSIVKSKCSNPSRSQLPLQSSSTSADSNAASADAGSQSDVVCAALAVHGRPPLRMVLKELLVCVPCTVAIPPLNSCVRYWGSTTATLDGSNRTFVGFITLVGSSDDGPVPPIRIM
jgi:hypothetical protein